MDSKDNIYCGKSTANQDYGAPAYEHDPFESGLVSVIIPVYNRERLIVEALESVRTQTYRPIETLVVDDGSTDDTVSVCQQVAEQWKADPGLTLRIFEQPHKGACAARNLGLRESKGEFIQFLDSDDLLVPDSIEKRLAHMAPGIDAVFGDVGVIRESGRRELYFEYSDWSPDVDLAYYLRKNIFICCPLHRKETLDQYGAFDEALSRGQETELHLRHALAGRRWNHLSATVFYMRFHGDGDRISGENWVWKDPFGYLRVHVMMRNYVRDNAPEAYTDCFRATVARLSLLGGRTLIRHGRYFAARRYFAEARRTGNGHTLVLANGYGRLGRFVCSHIGIYWGEILRATIVTPCRGLTSLLRSLLRHRAEPRAHATDRLAVPGERPGRGGDNRVEGQSV
ncbi:MAG TPA: glycosyltransferase [Dissulfurispiraceae bacterium]|nr:glycosyltransferase [Dissulfurispiraceae bacterium]